MDWREFRRALAVEHFNQPQHLRRVDLAIAALAPALADLASMGHVFHLAPGPGSAPFPWPRLYFHATDAPNGRIVHDARELGELGPGWAETLDEAQYEMGKATQDAGRGGIVRQALPTATFAPLTEPERIAERERIRAEARARAVAAKWPTTPNDSKGEQNGTSE